LEENKNEWYKYKPKDENNNARLCR
jgi:hypothetical protein